MQTVWCAIRLGLRFVYCLNSLSYLASQLDRLTLKALFYSHARAFATSYARLPVHQLPHFLFSSKLEQQTPWERHYFSSGTWPTHLCARCLCACQLHPRVIDCGRLRDQTHPTQRHRISTVLGWQMNPLTPINARSRAAKMLRRGADSSRAASCCRAHPISAKRSRSRHESASAIFQNTLF